MPTKSYGFAIGNLAARENLLLKKADLIQLSALKSTDALADNLRDRGYGNRTAKEAVPELLKSENEHLWQFLIEISPDDSLFAPFTAENDFHNLKTTLKGIIRNVAFEESLILPAGIDAKTLKTAVSEKSFDILPDGFADAALRAYEIFTSSVDVQLSDAVLDRACMELQQKIVYDKAYKSTVAREIIEYSVFFSNIKTALRAAKAQKSTAFLDEALAECKLISKTELKTAALAGTEQILEYISSRSNVGRDAALSYEKSGSMFEKFCDDYIMEITRKAKFITLGSDPIVAYMMARKAEFKDIRIIYSGIKTGQSETEILERLRELYG